MKLRFERRHLFHQPVGQFLTCDDGKAGNVVDGLFGIKLCALTAWSIQDVDQLRLKVQESQLEHREKPDRACSDDDDIGFDGSIYSCYFHT